MKPSVKLCARRGIADGDLRSDRVHGRETGTIRLVRSCARSGDRHNQLVLGTGGMIVGNNMIVPASSPSTGFDRWGSSGYTK